MGVLAAHRVVTIHARWRNKVCWASPVAAADALCQAWEMARGQDPWPDPGFCSNDVPTPKRGWAGRQVPWCSSSSCRGTSALTAGKSSVAARLVAVARAAGPVLQARHQSLLQCQVACATPQLEGV
eukprot:193165-Amphidinium_carterae.2